MTNVAVSAEALLASLMAQAEGRGIDLVTLRALVEESSQAGARRALASLGLDDERARRDMDELRELLSAWRDAKRSAWRAVVTWAVRLVLAMLLIGIAVRLRLTDYDAQRDYQTGLSQSDVVDQFGTEAKIELPAVIGASEARALAEDMMARRWAQRDKLVLRLPPRFITLRPGAQIELMRSPIRWQVHRSTIDGMVAVVELRPVWRTQAALAADPGRLLATHDILAGELSMALVELPDLTGESASSPMHYLAASTPTAGWKPVPVEVSCGAFLTSSRTANRKAVMGHAVTMLTDDSFEVQLIDDEQWLGSCDVHDLTGGTNLALLGDELLQFADVCPLGGGRFRLAQLRRGSAETKCAFTDHAIGDLFLLIDPASMQPITLPIGASGSIVTVTQRATGVRATTTIDAEGREVIAQILAALRQRELVGT